jgi:hypothetical protein
MITALSTIQHDGTTYQPGQEIPDLSEGQAATLVACGAAQAAEVSEPEQAKPQRQKGGD